MLVCCVRVICGEFPLMEICGIRGTSRSVACVLRSGVEFSSVGEHKEAETVRAARLWIFNIFKFGSSDAGIVVKIIFNGTVHSGAVSNASICSSRVQPSHLAAWKRCHGKYLQFYWSWHEGRLFDVSGRECKMFGNWTPLDVEELNTGRKPNKNNEVKVVAGHSCIKNFMICIQ